MLSTLFSKFVEFIVSTVGYFGYWGIFVLMTIESSFVPFPSEIILPPAGVLIAQGKLNWFLVFVFGVLGSLVGALFNYYIALLLGRRVIEKLVKRYGSFFLITEEHFFKVERYFREHGSITTFVGRLLPGIRQLISLPAGFARMNLLKFLLYTFLGAGIWAGILIYVGYLYGSNTALVNTMLDKIGWSLVGFVAVIVLVYVLIKKYKKKQKYLF